LVVFPPKWDNPHLAPFARERGHAVAVEAGAVDKKIGREFSARGCRDPLSPSSCETSNLGLGQNACAPLLYSREQAIADLSVVDNAFFRHVQGGNSTDVGFELAHLRCIESPQSLKSIRDTAFQESLK